MTSHLSKQHWLDRAIEIHKFHVSQLKTEKGWTIEKTAEALNRSFGSVAQDIMLAEWCRTHEKQLRRFRSMKSALDYVREKRKAIKLTAIE